MRPSAPQEKSLALGLARAAVRAEQLQTLVISCNACLLDRTLNSHDLTSQGISREGLAIHAAGL